jgi:hypothetical protein
MPHPAGGWNTDEYQEGVEGLAPEPPTGVNTEENDINVHFKTLDRTVSCLFINTPVAYRKGGYASSGSIGFQHRKLGHRVGMPACGARSTRLARKAEGEVLLVFRRGFISQHSTNGAAPLPAEYPQHPQILPTPFCPHPHPTIPSSLSSTKIYSRTSWMTMN